MGHQMHRLSHIAISNFRACRSVSFPLESFTPLVGQNNTGKSTLLEAIKWVLKPSALAASDFADANQPLAVAACIEGVTAELLDNIPEKKHRTAIEPFCKNEKLWVRSVANGTGKNSISQEVWDIDAYTGIGVPKAWRPYPTGLPQAVSVLLPEALHIEAMDDIGEDLGKAKAGTTIKELLDEIMVPVLKAHPNLNDALDMIRHILTADGNNRSGHLKDFDTQATTALGHFFPGLALDLDLQIIDIKEFFKAGDLHVTDKLTGDRHRFDQMGTGAQRAIQMALIRYLAETRSSNPEKTSRRLLLIDEPELYLHPQGVRRLRQALYTLSAAGFQVVFSTHSPLMLSRENAADTVIVGKTKEDGTTTLKPLRQAVHAALSDAESQSRALFELGNLADIYFSERVVLCEGKTDRRLLSLAYECLFGQPSELDQITFLSLASGCNDIPKALPVLAAMGIKACAVADLDFAFKGARTVKPFLLDPDGQDVKTAVAAFTRLTLANKFPLGDDGLPKNGNGWRAEDAWALFAKDADGQTICQMTHESLLSHRVWVWTQGCIENVSDFDAKGEDAILAQEQQLRAMSAADIEKAMPAFKACFEWIRST